MSLALPLIIFAFPAQPRTHRMMVMLGLPVRRWVRSEYGDESDEQQIHVCSYDIDSFFSESKKSGSHRFQWQKYCSDRDTTTRPSLWQVNCLRDTEPFDLLPLKAVNQSVSQENACDATLPLAILFRLWSVLSPCLAWISVIPDFRVSLLVD